MTLDFLYDKTCMMRFYQQNTIIISLPLLFNLFSEKIEKKSMDVSRETSMRERGERREI
jgi:hypothetical protein